MNILIFFGLIGLLIATFFMVNKFSEYEELDGMILAVILTYFGIITLIFIIIFTSIALSEIINCNSCDKDIAEDVQFL